MQETEPIDARQMADTRQEAWDCAHRSIRAIISIAEMNAALRDDESWTATRNLAKAVLRDLEELKP